jgi:hypothetical protein
LLNGTYRTPNPNLRRGFSHHEVVHLTLADGEIARGLLSIPQSTQKPLLVGLHGGTYDAEYFDASPEYFITRVTDPLVIPVIALNRPGYGIGMSLNSKPIRGNIYH